MFDDWAYNPNKWAEQNLPNKWPERYQVNPPGQASWTVNTEPSLATTSNALDLAGKYINYSASKAPPTTFSGASLR